MYREEKAAAAETHTPAARLRAMADVIEHYDLTAASWRAALLGTRAQYDVEVPIEFLTVLRALGAAELDATQLAAELRGRADAME